MEPEDIDEVRLEIAKRIAGRDVSAGFYAKIDQAISQLMMEKESQRESIYALQGVERAKDAKLKQNEADTFTRRSIGVA